MYKQAAEYVKSKINIKPKIGIILGTGLKSVADNMQIEAEIPYTDIPGFPVAAFHKGRLLIGTLCGVEVAIMQGRGHYYEGNSMSMLSIPVRILKLIGVEKLIVTNASGGINPEYIPGDIVMISDHIKFDLDSPLRGENPDELGDRFFDMTDAYSKRLREIAIKAAQERSVKLPEGVYAYMGGPQFETPAEIRMLRILGADLVGMSTVPDVITAVHCGIEVLGLSCVTNMAAGMAQGGFDPEVIAAAEKRGQEGMRALIEGVIGLL